MGVLICLVPCHIKMVAEWADIKKSPPRLGYLLFASVAANNWQRVTNKKKERGPGIRPHLHDMKRTLIVLIIYACF